MYNEDQRHLYDADENEVHISLSTTTTWVKNKALGVEWLIMKCC